MPLPFVVSGNAASGIQIMMHVQAAEDTTLNQATSYTWLSGYSGQLTIDMSNVPTVNSMICAWLISLRRAAPDAQMLLVKATPRVQGSLRALRLEKLFEIRAGL